VQDVTSVQGKEAGGSGSSCFVALQLFAVVSLCLLLICIQISVSYSNLARKMTR